MGRMCKLCKKKDLSEGRTLHGFPLEDPALLEIWKRKLNLPSTFIPTKYTKICSDHFKTHCFKLFKTRKTLNPGSVPEPCSEMKQACFYCNATRDSKPGISLRKFPLTKPDILNKWLQEINKENFVPNKDSLICSEHFEKSCFSKTKNRTRLNLTETAVPSIFYKDNHEPEQPEQELPQEPIIDVDIVDIANQNNADLHDVESHAMRDVACSNDKDLQSTIAETDLQSTIPETELSCEYESTQFAFTSVTTSNQEKIQENRRNVNHDHRYHLDPTVQNTKLTFMQQKFKTLQQTIKTQKRCISRLTSKVQSVTDILKDLHKKKSIPETGLNCLDSIASSDVGELFNRFLINRKNVGDEMCVLSKKKFKSRNSSNGLGISREQYPPALRCFSMTLHFYSPKAYNFIRQKFCRALPDPSTLRSWYSSIDGEPGFTTESFQALKLKVQEAAAVGKKVICSLMLDEMAIKSGLQNVSVGKIRGYVDFGTETDSSDEMPLAKDALVIMVVSLDGSWKLPIGYFLINGIDSATNAQLVNSSLLKLHEVGVEVVSVTLDGPSQHFATMRLLGANMAIDDCRPYFPHPLDGTNIFVIFDACHMLKLIRNCLGEYKILKDGDGRLIRWDFIEKLIVLQQGEGLRAGNKLKLIHLNYHKLKMKVFLAAQTLSSSVADANEYCDKDLNLKEFENSEGTVRFIRCVDRIFDFLNSRNPFAKGYKAPLNQRNEFFWRPNILEEIDYLQKITNGDGVLMTKTRRYVPFVGLISASMSIMFIFDNLIKRKESQLKYLLTYKFSQDHLELFFCAVRSCGGWCPNPTAAQFISAYKRLLVHHEVRAANGNATALDLTTILSVPSTRPVKVDLYDTGVYDKMSNERVSKKYGLDEEQPFNDDNQIPVGLPETLSTFSKSCIGHICGWVVKKLVDAQKPIVKCERCQRALFQRSQKHADFEENGLIEAKTRGGLIYPSESVAKICIHTENLLRHSFNKINCLVPNEKNFPAVMCSKVMTDLLEPPCTLFQELNDHLFDDAVEEPSHVFILIKKIVCQYIKLRMYSATKLASEAAVGDKLRSHLNRQIIWQRQ